MKNLTDYIVESVQQCKDEFVVIKPGFLDKRNEILDFLFEHGFMVKTEITRVLSMWDARELYKPHKKEDFYDALCEYMCSGESLGMRMLNFKGEDLDKVKDEVRERWGKDEMRNAMHSSDSPENVLREENIYFRKKEKV